MMNITEFENKMNELISNRDEFIKLNNWESADEVLDKIHDLQYEFMENFLDEYEQKADAKVVICRILDYIIGSSYSGNVVEYFDNEKDAKAAEAILWSEIGDMLLSVDCYQFYDKYAVDCVFGGMFVPDWKGFEMEDE